MEQGDQGEKTRFLLCSWACAFVRVYFLVFLFSERWVESVTVKQNTHHGKKKSAPGEHSKSGKNKGAWMKAKKKE